MLSQVGIAPKADEEIAAMWAAANADQLAEATGVMDFIVRAP